MAAPNLTYESAGHVATITINRPERHDAFDLPTLDALHEAWHVAEGDVDVRAVVLTGGEDAFGEHEPAESDAAGRERRTDAHPAYLPELVLGKPIVAAVDGPCRGGGFELLLASDVRIAGDAATFAMPGVRRGGFPIGGAAARAPRRIGWANAMDLLLTGDVVDAEAALRMGLVSRVVPAGRAMDAARAIAARIAANGTEAVRAIKESALFSDGMPLETALERQSAYAKQAYASAGTAEELKALRERRPPRF